MLPLGAVPETVVTPTQTPTDDTTQTPTTYKLDLGDGEKDYTLDDVKGAFDAKKSLDTHKSTYKYTDDDLESQVGERSYQLASHAVREWLQTLGINPDTAQGRQAAAAAQGAVSAGQTDQIPAVVVKALQNLDQKTSTLNDAIADDRLERFINHAKTTYTHFDEDLFLGKLIANPEADPETLAKEIHTRGEKREQETIQKYLDGKKTEAGKTIATQGGPVLPGGKKFKTVEEATAAAVAFFANEG